MDWAKLFSDNATSLFTLGGVLLGAVLGIVGTLLANWHDSKERQKERTAKQKEATAALTLELAMEDRKIVEGAIDNVLKALDMIWDVMSREKAGLLDDDQLMEELKSLIDKEGKFHRLSELDSVSHKLADAFGDDFAKEYDRLDALWLQFFDCAMTPNGSQGQADKTDELRKHVISQSGKLHIMLAQKMIAIKDEKQ